MGDKGFTMKDIPPFLEGGKLSALAVEKGGKIASLRIHVEIKTCKQTIPISKARLANQIVCVCAYLRNFQPDKFLMGKPSAWTGLTSSGNKQLL